MMPVQPRPRATTRLQSAARERWAHRGSQVVLSEGWGKLYQQQSELLQQTRVDVGALNRVVEHDRRILVHEKTRVETLKRERLQLAALREALQEELRLLRSSYSWRLTAPLRAALDMLASIRAGRYMGRWFKAPQVMGQQARSQILKRLSAAAYRSPTLLRLAQAALNKSLVLRRWVNAESGAGNASLQPVDRNPALLSPRAHASINSWNKRWRVKARAMASMMVVDPNATGLGYSELAERQSPARHWSLYAFSDCGIGGRQS